MAVAEKISDGVSRRCLLTGGLAGGFLLAFHLPVRAVNEPVQPPDDDRRQVRAERLHPHRCHRQDHAGDAAGRDGAGRLYLDRHDSGRRTRRRFFALTLEHAPPSDKLYGNPLFGIQATGNSNSVRAWWKPLRTAGASARAMLVQAAAQQWQVDPASCTTANSEVMHKASGRQLSYGALAVAASSEVPPKDVPLKDPKDFVLIGKPLKRLDTPDKVNGKAVYGIDAMLPGMKFATLAACPVFGGKVAKVDDSAARKIPGVRKVVVLDDLVAVVGDHMWAAKKGLEALVVDWDEGPNARVSSKDIWDDLRAASEKDGAVAKSGATSPRALPPASSLKRHTSCRFSRMRRWSRSTRRFMSSPTPAKSGPARRS